MQTPPSDTPTEYPRPNLDSDRASLREIAAGQRQIVFCILGQLVLIGVNIVAGVTQMVALGFVVALCAVGLLVYMIVSVIKLAKGLQGSPVLYVILMFVPCISLLTLLSLSAKATSRLQKAGIKVGLLGADPSSI